MNKKEWTMPNISTMGLQDTKHEKDLVVTCDRGCGFTTTLPSIGGSIPAHKCVPAGFEPPTGS